MCTASTVKLSCSINCSVGITNVPSLAIFESRSPGSVEQEHVLAIKMFDSQEPIKITKRSRWLQYYCINRDRPRIAAGTKRVGRGYSLKCNLRPMLVKLNEFRSVSYIERALMRAILFVNSVNLHATLLNLSIAGSNFPRNYACS